MKCVMKTFDQKYANFYRLSIIVPILACISFTSISVLLVILFVEHYVSTIGSIIGLTAFLIFFYVHDMFNSKIFSLELEELFQKDGVENLLESRE